jgi:hypothetical protein
MQTNVKNSLPDWWTKISPDKNFLVIESDIDSLWTALFLKQKLGIEIGAFFYDFTFLYHNKEITNGKIPVYVDIDIVNGFTFSNHPMVVENPLAINLNRGIADTNYKNKYAGSTLSTVFSLLDFDFSSLSKDQLMLMLCVDAGFKGYYNPDFREVWLKWYDKALQIPHIEEVMGNTREVEFKNIIGDYKLSSELKLDCDNQLQTDIDFKGIKRQFNIAINLPDTKFNEIVSQFDKAYTSNFDIVWRMYKTNSLYSAARTYKNSCAFSLKI